MTIKSAEVSATGTLVATGARVMGIYFAPAGTAGSVVLKDGGASGTVKCTLDTPAAADEMYIRVPGAGLDFGTDVHATLLNVSGVTIFYDDL